jgi:uncharacterized protein YcbX
MATIKVAIGEEELIVSSENGEIEIPFELTIDTLEKVKIWSSSCKAKVYGKEVNDWFSDVLQADCRLVMIPEEARRKVNYFYAVHKTDEVSFADAYPVLLIGENSLADLNSRLENKVPMNRFRPNLVFDKAEPFAEDNWKKIKIGETLFHLVKPCARCVITTINQETGIPDLKEPLKTLASYRIPKNSIKRKILFGQNMIADNPGGVLRVGDRVEIVETKS